MYVCRVCGKPQPNEGSNQLVSSSITGITCSGVYMGRLIIVSVKTSMRFEGECNVCMICGKP
jgi:hypothetical protein